jgi:hypothetical protein
MIKTLRKRHLQIWTLWSVLIPIGIISAVLVRPEFPKDKLLQPTATAALPVIRKSFNKENYTINIRSNNDGSQLQLEWINKKTLTYPTATIYQTINETKSIHGAFLIGRIEARGVYRFALKKDIANNNYHFILYDFIHQQIIETINF